MKRAILCVFLLTVLFCTTLQAQDSSNQSLAETARQFLRKGDLDNAILVYHRAASQDPANREVEHGLAYAYYLRKDYRNAIDIGKKIIDRSDADEPAYQLLGLCYKAIANYSECDKLYRKGLKAYPKSGILYSEYGELLASQGKLDNAIVLWEKGIEADPNNGNNYYNAAHYYDERGNLLWAVLYGEIFINIESLTSRTTGMKTLVTDDYKQILGAPDKLNAYIQKGAPFTKAVATILLRYLNLANEGVTPESLTTIRTRFILDWFNEHSGQFAFRLFDHQRQLLQEGSFSAYNQWVFNSSQAAYDSWVSSHETENSHFVKLQRSKVFKIPAGQYYPH